MGRGKGFLGKVVSILVIMILLVIALLNAITPIKFFRSENQVENGFDGVAEVKYTGQVTGWRDRVFGYPSRLGRHYDVWYPVYGMGWYEQKWLFEDSKNEYNDLYCIESGETHANTYNIYDLYSFSDDSSKITQYFGNMENYRHFMWILENMYTTNTSNQTDIEKNLIDNKLCKLDENARNYYNDMLGELKTRFGTESNSVALPLYITGTNGQQPEVSEYNANVRDTLIKLVQNYILLQYARQDNSNEMYNGQENELYGVPVLDYREDGYNVFDIEKFDDNTNNNHTEIGNSTSIKKFAYVLANYLINKYDSNNYNLNKFKGFYDNGYDGKVVITQASDAKYDSESGKVGPYTIKNYYGFSSILKSVKYGDQAIDLDKCKVIDENGEEFSLHAGTSAFDNNERKFYIQLPNEVSLNDNKTLSIEFFNDYGEVPKASIYVPADNTVHPQIVVNVQRNHESERKLFTINVEGDIALKKYIYKVGDTTVDSRLSEIDTTGLDQKTSTDAEYKMRKSPVDVNLGDKILYRIQMFNEGNVDGRAKEIKDYLPSGLTYLNAYTDSNKENVISGVTVNTKGNIVTIPNPNESMMPKYKGGGEQELISNSQSIYVECQVTGLFDGAYTNVSEITKYDFEIGEDKDSTGENWNISVATKDNNGYITSIDTDSNEWKNYSNNQDDKVSSTDFEYFVGQEDDDDFDKIVVKKLDLALTKKINATYSDGQLIELKAGDVSKDKEEISGIEEVKNNTRTPHTLTYTMNKKLAEVTRGDVIVSTITIYNEGNVNGAVLEVTDFIPKGLEFNKAVTEELNEGLGIESYTEANSTVKVKFNDWKVLNAISEENEVDKISFKLAFTVSSNAEGNIINSAAITKYGYKTSDDELPVIEANKAGQIDVDSEQQIPNKNTLINKHRANMNSVNRDNNSTEIDKSNIDVEDDDDADGVYVPVEKHFDLSLRKYISKIGNNTYNRAPEITDSSVQALERTGTAEYYHKKNKLYAAKGDLVTYKIRVYNEGQVVGNTQDYAGRATQIKDYLPDGIEFVELEEEYRSDWDATLDGNVITFSIKNGNDKILQPGSIDSLAGLSNQEDGAQYYQEIGIVCRVVGRNITPENAGDAVVMTNRAATTEYEVYDENNTIVNGVHDRDSVPDELDSSNLDDWYKNTVENESNPEIYYPGRKDNQPKGEEEDDNDFDTVYISNYVISLNKHYGSSKLYDGSDTLKGTTFEIKKYSYLEGESNAIPTSGVDDLDEFENAVHENGYASYYSSIPSDENGYDVYIIKETQNIEGYNDYLADKYIKITLKHESGLMKIVKTNGIDFEIYNNDDQYIEYNESDTNSPYKYVDVRALGVADNSNASGAFIIDIDNTSNYKLKIGKKSSSTYIGEEPDYITRDTDYLANASFEVKQYLNVSTLGLLETRDFLGQYEYITEDELEALEQSSDTLKVESIKDKALGLEFAGNEEVEITNTSTIDLYKITEEDAPEGYAVESKPIYIKIHKGIEANGKLGITRVEVLTYNSEFNRFENITAGGTLDGVSTFGRIKAPGLWAYNAYDGLRFRIDFDKENNTVIFTKANPVKTGDYKILINKKEKNKTNSLEGAVFTAEGPDSATIQEVTTDGTFQAKEIISNSITNENVGEDKKDIYTITEKKAPAGYFMLKNPITVEVENKNNSENSGYEVNKFIVNNEEVTSEGITITGVELDGTDKTVSITATVSNKTLSIVVENEKIPEPEIHKGVKTVENQDSGYNYIDLESGKSYTEDELKSVVHEWVVETPIPEGINSYKKFGVQDPIDLTKLELFGSVDNVEIYKVDAEDNAVRLVKDSDYKISYSEDEENQKGNLEVKYIADNFKGAFLDREDTKVGEKLRIVFNTTFKKDENGVPVILKNSPKDTENAENTAYLSYSIDNLEYDDIESETPEVHTGRVAVFKYKDVNKNGVYDKGTDEPLKNAVFQIAYSADETGLVNLVTGPDGKPLEAVTDDDGIAVFTGLQFGGDATSDANNASNEGNNGSTVYKYDWETAQTKYYIQETEAPLGYTKSDKIVEVTVSKNSSEVVDLSDEIESFANIEKEGQYQILLNKVDENGIYKAGAEFSIEVEGNTAATLYNPILPDGTKRDRLVLENTITDSNLGPDNKDVYYITEEKAPAGYFKLKDKIKVEVENTTNSNNDGYRVNKFTINGHEPDFGKIIIRDLELEGTDKKASLSATVYGNTLIIVVTNEKIPEPEIHKGVKTVENQDSGYYYRDLVSGKTYDRNQIKDIVHDWVVETTIPEGISSYTKYSVKDPIDLSKLEFYGSIDDVEVSKVDEEGNITKLTKDTDYKISYNIDEEKQKGNLLVEYITDDFRGAFLEKEDTKVGEKLRIVFNTTFKKDDSGVPVVLKDAIQNADNTSYLSYAIDGVEFDDKKSETPEVHTGRAAVFKYEDVNKNGVYDENVDKPLRDAVFQIATDPEAKNFVKGEDGKPLQAISNDDGIAIFTGLQFGGDATDVEGKVKYNWETAKTDYYIKEMYAPAGFIKTDKIAKVTVSKDSYDIVDLSEELKFANIEKEGLYNFTITKRDAETSKIIENEVTVFDIVVYSKEQFTEDNIVVLKDKTGNTINTKGIEAQTNGIAEIKDILISSADVSAGTYYFVITETKAPDKYTEIDYRVVVPISFTETEDGYTAIHQNKNAYALVKDENGVEEKASLSSMSTNENECVSTEQTDLVINVNVPNKLQKFDLSLRKFITAINDKALEVSREPVTDTKDLVSGKSTTAKYEHSKEPVLVTQKDIVEYTIRVYNEGEMDGYASMILDDVPEGVEMIAPNYTPDGKAENVNAEYRWVMCRLVREGEDVTGKETFTYDNKLYVITNEASEADAIVTDYLSFEMGKVAGSDENKNLLKAFDPKVGAFTPDNYRDIKVQFKVKEGKADKLITNHAQIIDNRDSNNNYIIDIDSTPNAWENPPRDDDQDYDVIRVGYFDLALYKWVTTAVVTEDGKTKSYDSSHTLFDKSNVVNVNVPKNKINDVVVKFKYQILVENQGVIAGKATEIKDHIPEGLKFVQEDNKDFGWVLNEDGTVSTDYLKDTVLQPNEKTEVTIVLTWINGSNNLGKKTNYAEISQDYNEYNWSDIDSTPNNFSKEPKEDDEDKDVVMLQIKTGNDKMVAYVVIGMVVMTIVSTGVLAIKKFVLSV